MWKTLLLIIIFSFFTNLCFAANGDITAITVSSTAHENGWVAIVTIDSSGGTPIQNGGTYNFGIDNTSVDFSSATFVLTVTSAGYVDGVLGTRTRTVYGTLYIRKAFPDCATLKCTVKDETLAAGVLTIKIALSDPIYASDTVTAVVAGGASPLYTDGTTPNSAYSGAVINNSTLNYPPVIARWAKPDFEQIKANTYTAEVLAFNGFGIDSVCVSCTDSHSHTATATITSQSVSIWSSTSGGVTSKDQNAVTIFAGDINFSANSFTAKDPVTCNFTAYPKIGNAASIADSNLSTVAGSLTSGTFVNREVIEQQTSGATAYVIMPLATYGSGLQIFGISGTPQATDGLTWTGATSGAVYTQTAGPVTVASPDERLHQLVLLYDPDDTYGSPVVVVDAVKGHASADVTWVFASQAAADNISTGYPSDNTLSYTTMGYALQACKSYNNANNGHNDPGGCSIELAAGTHTFTTGLPSSDQGAQATWVTIKPYTNVPRADAIITDGYTAATKTRFMKVSGVSLSNPSGNCIFYGATNSMLWLDNNAIDFTKTVLDLTMGTEYDTFNTITALTGSFKHYSTYRKPHALVRGNYKSMAVANAGITSHLYCVIGNDGIYPGIFLDNGNAVNSQSSENSIAAYNTTYNWSAGGYYWLQAVATTGGTLYNGVGIIQNVVEIATATTCQYTSKIDAEYINNVVAFHNTLPGERTNLFYDNIGSTTHLRTNLFLKNNIYSVKPTKGDYFSNIGTKTISGITSANPGVITSNSHGLSDGDVVYISGVSGAMGTLLNGTYQTVANKSTNTFEIQDTSSKDACSSSCGTADGRNGNRLGSWYYEHNVGSSGEYIIEYNTFEPQFEGLFSFTDDFPTSYRNGFAHDATQSGALGSGDGTGNGDYNLMYNSIPRVLSNPSDVIVPYDIAGNVRPPGFVSSGAFQYKINPILY